MLEKIEKEKMKLKLLCEEKQNMNDPEVIKQSQKIDKMLNELMIEKITHVSSN